MIFFTNRNYETIAIADNETEKGLKLIDDELNQTIKSGTAIYTATIGKSDKTSALIESGCFVFVPNFKGKIIVLEVMEVEESREYKKIIAEDAGLELLNSDVGDHKMKGTLREHIMATIGDDSDWVIGRDDIGNSHNLSLEYTGLSNQTKRIAQIAGRFGAEVSYDFLFDGSVIKEKRINFHKQRGRETALRLEVGKELSDVKRNVSITNLRTAVLGIGKPHKETIKTTKTVKKKVKVNEEVPGSLYSYGKLEKFIDWFKARKGKVRYSMSARYGPNSYDCSSALHYAAKHAGLLPGNHVIGSTETLFAMKGKYLDEISRSEIRFGDIFVAGRQGYSGGAGGHTGAVLDKNRIIHCTYSKNGIAITNINGYTGGPPVRWFRWRNSGAGTVSKSSAKYWTDSDLTKHDLGWTLNGLNAGQLNNWIKATAPGSPFIGQGNVFMEAQKQSGLDARYILAHAALESAWGRSNIARKYHNYFGINAYDSNPDYARTFSNSGLASGIIGGAKWIAKNYYNSKYKQTTLYKMRNNGGVHQYATDPKWHTKIANIMKRSERFTNPAKATKTKTKTVLETVPDTKEVEKATNLIGYKYDDGRFFVDNKGRVCDREANATWSKPNSKGRYLTRIYESEATSAKTLFDECLGQLKKNNSPEVTYDVSPNAIPKDIDIGDSVRIIDHDYSPALYLDARLVEVTTSSTSKYIEKAIFANFVEKESGIASSLLKLQDSVRDFKFEWDSLPYTMEISSSSGNVFKEDTVNTMLIATVRRAGIDQTPNIDGFIWERVSKYPDKLVVSDDKWNEEHKDMNEHFIELVRSDVELEASFTCSAIVDDVAVASASYTIKNLLIGIYKQEEEPDRSILQWGDVWQWDDGQGKHFKRIWKGDRWEDTVTKRDLELIELTPGPPGQDGKDGMPGKPGADGRTSYMHFAYADSADGAVGFTLTATKGKEYIGFYSDFEKADSNSPSKYEWSKFVGDDGKPGKDGSQGIPGKAGADGKTPYFHTAWANSADGNKDFSTSQAGEKAYIGTYTDYESKDSTNPSDYTWQLVKGEDGRTVIVGQNLLRKSNEHIVDNTDYRVGQWYLCETPETGELMTFTIKIKMEKSDSISVYNSGGMIVQPGASISVESNVEYKIYSVTFKWRDKYYYVAGDKWFYQDNPPFINIFAYSNGNGSNQNSNKVSIEWATLTRGDIPAIEWSPCYLDLMGTPGQDGKDGMPGKPGADGRTSYMHFAYADSADGAVGFTLTATKGKEYIGFYTDFEKADSKDPTKYEWSKFVGDDGKPGKDGSQGIPGKAGADGKTPYFHTAWANSADGSKDFSTSQAGEKAYIGTYTDYESKDSTNPSDYTWQLVKGEKGDTGKQGVAGIPGKDGKTGKIGQNLLRKSNEPIIDNTDYRAGQWYLCETPETGELMTFTIKIKMEKSDSISVYNSGGMIVQPGASISVESNVEYKIYSVTFKWRDKYYYVAGDKWFYQDNPPFINIFAYSNGNGSNQNSNKVSIEWATLTRGDIPAIEWSPCYMDIDDSIAEKADSESVNNMKSSLQDLQVHFAIYPTAEELKQNKLDLIKQEAYLEELKTAIDSNALSLQDRIDIIEANVGAGKLTLEAINTYLNFGEEGVLIGKEGDQIRLRLINNALEITDGTKVVARFANNQTETPNLKVSGVLEFGYHVASKVDLDGDKFTVISPNI